MEMEGELLFGPFALSLDRRELRLDGCALPLGARAVELLVLLAGRAGEVVGKDEIVSRLARGADMEQTRLRTHVAALRRARGDGEHGSRYIVNVLGRGYVFVAAVCRRKPPALPRVTELPGGAAPLVGREQTVASLARLVGERRLVSVVGAGGLGKSALALAAARQVAPRFGGQVAYLDLAPLWDGVRLTDALAGAVGLAVDGSLPGLCAALAERRLLLVLDNCGHLADAAALLAEALLAAAPRLHLLATSREALDLRAEWVHRLAPLALPAALELFALRCGTRFDPAGLAQSAQLCRQLEGNPLLIGLAAERPRTDGFAALADGVAALCGSGGEEGGRHQSADALLDWSWRLLAPRERAVLRRLSVFRRSFTLDDAARACACPEIDGAAVRWCMSGLVARSLVEVEYGRHGVRFRLTNATHHYARRDGHWPGRVGHHAVASSEVERMSA
jgi:predicted ATPase/DNA-binding winged helix-turn-helix (wHTH) protein